MKMLSKSAWYNWPFCNFINNPLQFLNATKWDIKSISSGRTKKVTYKRIRSDGNMEKKISKGCQMLNWKEILDSIDVEHD